MRPITFARALAVVSFVFGILALFPAFITWAICDGRGILPYAMGSLFITGFYAKKTSACAKQLQSSKLAFLSLLPFIINCLLIYLVSGEIKSCH